MCSLSQITYSRESQLPSHWDSQVTLWVSLHGKKLRPPPHSRGSDSPWSHLSQVFRWCNPRLLFDWETLSQNHSTKLLSDSHSQKVREKISFRCFKLLNSGIICYAIIVYQYACFLIPFKFCCYVIFSEMLSFTTFLALKSPQHSPVSFCDFWFSIALSS